MLSAPKKYRFLDEIKTVYQKLPMSNKTLWLSEYCNAKQETGLQQSKQLLE